MKKILLFIIVLFYISSTEVYSKNKFGVQAGINFSSFYNYDSDIIIGDYYGIYGDFYFLKKFAFSFGINYKTLGGKLKHIIVSPYAGDEVYSYNFNVITKYLDFPIKLKYNILIKSGLFLIQPFIGYSLFSIPTNDNSDRENKRFSGKLNEVIPDVQALGDPANHNIISGFHFGVIFYYRHFGLSINYFHGQKSLGGFEHVEELNKRFKVQSINILFNYIF